jgi:general secretion pathway protein D
MFSSRRLLNATLFGITLLSIVGCTNQDRDKFIDKANKYSTQDRELNYTRDDFRNAMAPRPVDPNSTMNSGTSVPDLAPVISEDKKNILPQPLVSITVNQDVPLRDIFYELAKQAEVDIELDPTITGSIIFTAYNRPFDQVVDRIADMAGLRYTFKNNVLRVERDTPYLKTYNVDFLGGQRKYTSTISSNTSAATSAAGGGGGDSNGSSSSITSTTDTDFWADLESNITQLIQNSNQQVSLTDQSAPITTGTAIPAVSTAQLAAVNAPNGTAAAPVAAPTSITITTGAAPTAGLLNPTGTQNAAGGTTASGGASDAVKNPYFSVNRQAGLVIVFATHKQHEKVAAYLAQTMRAVNTQVLIEAKVFEVELNDENSLGIDWSLLSGNEKLAGGVSLTQQNFSTNPFTSGAGGIFQYTSGDLDVLVNAISRFGTVHALSSPRLTVLNNQTAILNVSESRVFFTLNLTRTESTPTSAGHLDITSQAKSVPEGLIVVVHPSINPDTHEITMNLRPSITRVVNTVADPAAAYIASLTPGGSSIQSLVPELSVREIDSMVKMSSGSTIVMGGLMQDRNQSQQVAVPVLGEVPILGNLFRSQLDGNKKTEMVVMLRAIVADSPKPDATDKDLYNKMGMDRHPSSM